VGYGGWIGWGSIVGVANSYELLARACVGQSELGSARREVEELAVQEEERLCDVELLKEQLAEAQEQNQHLLHNVSKWVWLS